MKRNKRKQLWMLVKKRNFTRFCKKMPEGVTRNLLSIENTYNDMIESLENPFKGKYNQPKRGGK